MSSITGQIRYFNEVAKVSNDLKKRASKWSAVAGPDTTKWNAALVDAILLLVVRKVYV